MSKIIASAAIRGAHNIVKRAEENLKKAIENYGPDKKVEFPNTGYYLPVIYGVTGMKVSTLGDMLLVLERAKALLPPVPDKRLWLPYLGPALDAGMATLFADEIIEAIKYVNKNIPYTMTTSPTDENIWLGAADDVIMRERGIEFVDGTAPGFAAMVGAAPTNEIAVKIARELQEKNLYVFMSASTNGKNMAEQLAEEGIQMGWETRLVPFGKDITATVFSLGFAARAAMAFGGIKPGDFKRILLYNRHRIFAFVIALGEVDDEKYAQAAGAINFGFPTIADTDIPQILPTGICLYEHVVSSVPHDEIVPKAIEVRGLKITVTEVPVPVSYGPAFEGERVRKENLFVEFGGGKSPSFELLLMKGTDEVEDDKIEVVGKEIDDISEGSLLPLGILIHVAGSKMQKDFEPILERQLHHFINGAQGVMHMGSRDIVWIRIAKDAKEKGFKLRHLGDIIRAKLLADFPAIVDKVQVTIYIDEDGVKELLPTARAIYHQRDERVAGMIDEGVDVWYSCTLCQSFAPDHVCVISPQRLGLCGAYNWLDGKAAFEINPTGPNQPVNKGEIIDAVKGQFKGVNEFVYKASHNKIEKVSMYSMMEDPMTSCLVAGTEIILDNQPVQIGNFIDKHRGGEAYTKVRALTLRSGKVASENLVAMQKFLAPRKLIKLVTKSGVELILTPDHGVAIDRPEGLSWVRADQIKVRDRVISLKKLNLETNLLETIDLIPDDFRVIDDKFLQILKNKLVARYGSFAAACYKVGIMKSDPRVKSLPIGALKKVVAELDEDWSQVRRLIRRIARGASVVDIPQMNPNLFYLMGLVASDGSITKRGKYEYFMSFINTSENLITMFKDTYQQLFPSRHIGVRKRRLNPSTVRDREVKPAKACFHCYFNNPVFGVLCEHYGIKIGSRGNWNLARMISLPEEFISAFIAGLFDGDGSVRIRKYDGKWNIGEAYLCIEDKRAALHLQLLLKRLGIVGNIRKSGSVYKIVMHGSALIQFAELIPIRHEGKKRVLEQITILAAGKEMDKSQQEVLPLAAGKEIAKLAAGKGILNSSTLFYYKTGRSRPVRSQVQKLLDSPEEFPLLDWMIDGDYFLDSIVKVEEVNNKGEYDFVYNLTIAKTHCYIVNGGPLVKNCGCFQCIVAVLPTTNGVMVVNREFAGMTPSGMTFSTMAGMVGGGQQTPGFSGVGKFFLTSPKFISADGGFKRIVWMPKELKEELRDMIEKRAKEIGEPDFMGKIADETVATTEEEVLEFMQKVGHPALEMPPMF